MNTNADPEHAPRCADCNVTMEYDDDRDDEGNLLNAWWHCPSCLRNESFCHATDAPPAPTPPADAPKGGRGLCSKCGQWHNNVSFHERDCADAEPPWVVAARKLWLADDLRIGELDPNEIERLIRTACEQHAAALAQERDVLLKQIERDKQSVKWSDETRFALSKELGVVATASNVVEGVRALRKERDDLRVANVGFQTAVEQAASERETLKAEIERLRSERK